MIYQIKGATLKERRLFVDFIFTFIEIKTLELNENTLEKALKRINYKYQDLSEVLNTKTYSDNKTFLIPLYSSYIKQIGIRISPKFNNDTDNLKLKKLIEKEYPNGYLDFLQPHKTLDLFIIDYNKNISTAKEIYIEMGNNQLIYNQAQQFFLNLEL